MIIGYFDFAIIGVLVLINILTWGKKVNRKMGCLIVGVLFGLILPLASQKIEVDRVIDEREIIDNFTLLYTYFKFPMYWLIGMMQMTIMSKNDINEES